MAESRGAASIGPDPRLQIYAPDIVYFDPGCERRIDGLAALTERYEAIRGRVLFDRFELINPLVQLVGDAAVLTYNYASYQGQKAPSRWNCTEVYRRAGGRWQIIQSHWSLTVPTPA